MIVTRCKVHKERLINSLPLKRCPRIQGANRHLCRLFLVGVWATAGCPAPGQVEDGAVRYELKPAEVRDRLSKVIAAVEVKTWQPDVRKGIELLLHITNNGAAAVELYDPLHRTDVSLINLALDPSGRRVSLPGEVGRVSPEEIRNPVSRARAIAEIETRRSFEVVNEVSRRRAPNVKGLDDVDGEWNGLLRLEPGEEFQVRLRVTRIMADPQNYWSEVEKPRPTIPKEDRRSHPPDLIPSHLSTAVPIPAGTYQLSIGILLHTPESVGEYRSSSRDGGLITVELGPKPEPGE